MAERFPLAAIPGPIHDIARRLREAGHETWFVGGAVRDVLYALAHGRPPERAGDFDIATAAPPAAVQALFRRTVPVGVEHGTLAVLDDDNRAHEVTTFRRDVKTDGRHAEVEFGVSLEDDLARRDFTINAIAVHPETGEIRDPFSGRADLERGIVRAVGDAAARFREDLLRVLRALRFAASFGFTVEPATWEAVRASADDLGELSRERVRDEWLKTLATAAPSRTLGLWREAGVLVRVWPELARLPREDEGRLDALTPRDPVVVTAAALADAGQDAAASQGAARRLRFSNRDIERVTGIVRALADAPPPAGDAAALRRWIARHRAVASEAAAATREGPAGERRRAVEATLASGAPLATRDLAVDGDDLRAAGIAAGPRMGEVLRALLEVVLDDPALNTREVLLARAKALP